MFGLREVRVDKREMKVREESYFLCFREELKWGENFSPGPHKSISVK
jgi:hypothetical protein